MTGFWDHVGRYHARPGGSIDVKPGTVAEFECERGDGMRLRHTDLVHAIHVARDRFDDGEPVLWITDDGIGYVPTSAASAYRYAGGWDRTDDRLQLCVKVQVGDGLRDVVRLGVVSFWAPRRRRTRCHRGQRYIISVPGPPERRDPAPVK